MKKLLFTLILFSSAAGFVHSDDSIYGPGGANLGPDGNPYQQQQRQNTVAEEESGSGLTLRQQSNGHYFVDGSINGSPLIFVIDTGASVVTLPREVALGAGIYCENDTTVETANGTAQACTGTIPKLKFGDFTLTDLRCIIVPKLKQALLGSNVLKDFKLLQNNGEMRITKKIKG
ncbi:retropepsin-like aspartic protease family protein [Methylomicrobium lacus]|uniref:retropepsin-like aspartic protease family protein n=1 Tax=Methylomicrobium lacus TaxID=136992 RepID=UPI00045EC0B4|nr:retropepsin-like aspartic protease [Methylomicrobium lacus]